MTSWHQVVVLQVYRPHLKCALQHFTLNLSIELFPLVSERRKSSSLYLRWNQDYINNMKEKLEKFMKGFKLCMSLQKYFDLCPKKASVGEMRLEGKRNRFLMI